MQFAAPVVRGLPRGLAAAAELEATAQFNAHRRDFDRKALRNDSDPPPAVPDIPQISRAAPGSGAALGRPDGEGPRRRHGSGRSGRPSAKRYEASFARFASVFPDVFYVSERGRYLPRRFAGQGTPAERGLSQRDGLLARRLRR